MKIHTKIFKGRYQRYFFFLVLAAICVAVYMLNSNWDERVWWYCYLFGGGMIPIFLAAYFVYPALEKKDRITKIARLVEQRGKEVCNTIADAEVECNNISSDKDKDSEFIEKAVEQALGIYTAHLSFWNHLVPVIILSSVAAFGNFVLFSYLRPLWGGLGEMNDLVLNFPVSVLYGFLSSNLFVLYSILSRFRSIDITPIMILGMGYQIILGTTTAFVITSLSPDYGDPFIAFLVGFIPFADLAKWFTSTAKEKLGTKQTETIKEDILEIKDKEKIYNLRGIAIEDASRLREEGIYTIFDLALSNPITLYFITPFKISQITQWINQAYLQMFLSAEKMEKLATMGIVGAMGIRVKSLAALKKQDKEKKQDEESNDFDEFVNTLADQLGEDKKTMCHFVDRIMCDPKVMLLEAIWLEFGSE